jgi:hypothetical protein
VFTVFAVLFIAMMATIQSSLADYALFEGK